MDRLGDTGIETPRLSLAALRVEDADELADVLDDERLHAFLGGRPLRREELRDRYGRLVDGPADPGETWLNWAVRLREDDRAVGTVQATVVDGGRKAFVAWVVGVPWQGRGIASEAAAALVDWLLGRGVELVEAHVHPGHAASAAVARRAGLEPTDAFADGERVWTRTVRVGV